MSTPVAGGSIAGSLVIVGVWYFEYRTKEKLPPEVAAAITVLVTSTGAVLTTSVQTLFKKRSQAAADRRAAKAAEERRAAKAAEEHKEVALKAEQVRKALEAEERSRATETPHQLTSPPKVEDDTPSLLARERDPVSRL
jgi:hypothetical protein